jgi:hypothetical protein
MVSHALFDDAVQPHPVEVTTLTVPPAALARKKAAGWVRAKLHPEGWVVGASSTYKSGPPLKEPVANIVPFWLILKAESIVQPEGARVLKSLVPFTASQIHPPASLEPTTCPPLFKEAKPTLVVLAAGGKGIAVLPAVVPMKA